MTGTALVVGGGGTLGVAICSDLTQAGYRVLATGRSRERLAGELVGTPVEPVEMELDASSVERVVRAAGPLDVLIYNAGRIDLASLSETTPQMFEEGFRVNALGAFLVARAAAPAMVERGRGSMVFIGATSSQRGGARTHAFASSKHALRGLSQSLAKELAPQGVHVAHLVIDGRIWGPRTLERFPEAKRENCIDAADVARAIRFVVDQPRSAWTFELDVRPFNERWS